MDIFGETKFVNAILKGVRSRNMLLRCLIHDKPLVYPDLSNLQNIAFSRDDAFPEIDMCKGFRKALKALSTVLARKERFWTSNCKARAESHMRSMPMVTS